MQILGRDTEVIVDFGGERFSSKGCAVCGAGPFEPCTRSCDDPRVIDENVTRRSDSWRWARYKLLDVLGIRTPGETMPAEKCHAWETLSFAGATSFASSASKLTVEQDGRPCCQHRYIKTVFTVRPGKMFYGPNDGRVICASCGEEVQR